MHRDLPPARFSGRGDIHVWVILDMVLNRKKGKQPKSADHFNVPRPVTPPMLSAPGCRQGPGRLISGWIAVPERRAPALPLPSVNAVALNCLGLLPRPLSRLWRFLNSWAPQTLSARLTRLGMVVVAVYLLLALVQPLLSGLALLPPVNGGLDNPIYATPSWAHWCGTDRLGRDVCVRTLAGTGVALQVVVMAVLLALAIGVPLGMVSGYLGGLSDRLLVLLMDTLYTLPVLLLSVVMAFLLGRGLLNAAIALCVVYIPQYFRVVRNQTASAKAELHVEAARSLGAGPWWILRHYLFRNVITSVPVLITLNAADAVLVLGGLGFLGLGLPETVPEWGSDLQQALSALPTGVWWTALYPGLAMFGLVLGLSCLGEGIDAWLSKDDSAGRAAY